MSPIKEENDHLEALRNTAAVQMDNLTAIPDSTPTQYRFNDVEEGEVFDLCMMRLTSIMQPCKYSIDANNKLSINAFGNAQDFFGMVRFDERTGDSKFVPNTGDVFLHYCEFVINQREEGGKIDGCAKVGVAGIRKNAGAGQYDIPLWKVASGQGEEVSVWFRENVLYTVNTTIQTKNEDSTEYSLFLARKAENETVGNLNGLNGIQLDGYYLIPLILPEKLVVFYATKDEATIQDWHKKLNDHAINPNKTLMAGINTPLFRDDKMSIFITFDADLEWYENIVPNP